MQILRNCVSGRQAGVVVVLLLAAGLPLVASPIAVTNQTTASLHTDDALFFTLATYGFAEDAAEFGLPVLPTLVSFGFVTSSPGPSGYWDALLETPGGSVIATFPDLMEFETAQYQSAGYTGPVGVLEGSLTLSSAEAQQVGDSPVVLVLQNLGSTATVGLPPYSIAHDLTVTLSGSGLTTGAVVDGVTLADPAPPGVPEPGSGWLLAAGAALCCATARRSVV
ncbi:MAG: hypothetical protein ACLQKA_16145 [Bryobacteraceae bacterium]